MALSKLFKSLYEHWTIKSQSYNNEYLFEVVDKFFTLFVLYNAVYIEAYNYLSKNDKYKEDEAYNCLSDTDKRKEDNAYKKGNDEFMAIGSSIKFLNCASVLEKLQESNTSKDAFNYIKQKFTKNNKYRLKICFKKTGEHLSTNDLQIINNLHSDKPEEVLEGVLTLIYKTRCNMFHARKELDVVQKSWLNPLSNIICVIVIAMYERLVDLETKGTI